MTTDEYLVTDRLVNYKIGHHLQNNNEEKHYG
jgi:hypothetical protein